MIKPALVVSSLFLLSVSQVSALSSLAEDYGVRGYKLTTKPNIETPSSGVIVDVIVDNKDATTETFKALSTSKGIYRILGKVPEAGTTVNIKGPVISDGVMAIEGYDIISSPQAYKAPDFTEENRQERILAVRLQVDETNHSPCSGSQIQNILFSPVDSVATYFSQMSRGKLTVTGEVYPQEIEVTGSPTICDSFSWSNQAEAILTSRGVNLEAYDKIMFFTPPASCGWVGLAQGIPSRRSWLNGSFCSWHGVVAHELGHNIGLPHASSPVHEYGDNSDVMGNYGARTTMAGLNAVNKIRLNYLSPEEILRGTPEIQNYSLTTVSPPLKEAGKPVVLTYKDNEMQHMLYLSYRQPSGFDANILDFFFTTLSVHSGTPDFSPFSRSLLVANLNPGQIYSEPNGLKVKLVSMNPGSAVVNISKACVRNPLTFSMPSTVFMRSDSTIETYVNIFNSDSNICPATNFSLSLGDHQGLAVKFETPAFSLPPQTNRSVKVFLTTNSSGVSPLSYKVILSGHDLGTRENTSSVIIDDIPPEQPVNLEAVPNSKCQFVNLTWSMPDFIEEDFFVNYEIFRRGVKIATTKFMRYKDEKLRRGRYSYQVRAIDNVGNASALTEPMYAIIRGGSWKACEATTVILPPPPFEFKGKPKSAK